METVITFEFLLMATMPTQPQTLLPCRSRAAPEPEKHGCLRNKKRIPAARRLHSHQMTGRELFSIISFQSTRSANPCFNGKGRRLARSCDIVAAMDRSTG